MKSDPLDGDAGFGVTGDSVTVFYDFKYGINRIVREYREMPSEKSACRRQADVVGVSPDEAADPVGARDKVGVSPSGANPDTASGFGLAFRK